VVCVAHSNALRPRPLARAFHTACLDAKRRRVLVFGGRGSQGDLDDLSVFDVATGRWHVGVRTSGLAPGARSKHSAAVVGDTMFVFGGENARRPVDPRAMFALDLDKMQWSLVRYTGVMPRCVGLQCAAVGSRLFVFCSEQEAPLRMLNCVSVFLAATSEWYAAFFTMRSDRCRSRPPARSQSASQDSGRLRPRGGRALRSPPLLVRAPRPPPLSLRRPQCGASASA
jgi:hypothetical protein